MKDDHLENTKNTKGWENAFFHSLTEKYSKVLVYPGHNSNFQLFHFKFCKLSVSPCHASVGLNSLRRLRTFNFRSWLMSTQTQKFPTTWFQTLTLSTNAACITWRDNPKGQCEILTENDHFFIFKEGRGRRAALSKSEVLTETDNFSFSGAGGGGGWGGGCKVCKS